MAAVAESSSIGSQRDLIEHLAHEGFLLQARARGWALVASPVAVSSSRGEATLPAAEGAPTNERQAQLRAITSELLYWKGGLKVLKQARLPKWRGCFQWQIEAQIEALQTSYATLRAEVAKPDG